MRVPSSNSAEYIGIAAPARARFDVVPAGPVPYGSCAIQPGIEEATYLSSEIRRSLSSEVMPASLYLLPLSVH